MPAPLLLPAIGIASAAIKGIQGYAQRRKANKALDELYQTPEAQYGVSPELQKAYDRADAMARMGFAPEEKAQFQSQLARNQAGVRQTALDLGGSPQAINAVLQANQTDAITDFAAKGAGLRRESMRYADTLAQAVQAQKNLDIQQKIARRQMLESAYGQASAMGTQNMFGALTDVANIGMASFKTPGLEEITEE